MPKSVHISAPPATLEEVARNVRISKRRQNELSRMAEEFVRQLKADKKASAKHIDPDEKRKNASAAD